jgi:hypothetical protein
MDRQFGRYFYLAIRLISLDSSLTMLIRHHFIVLNYWERRVPDVVLVDQIAPPIIVLVPATFDNGSQCRYRLL